MKVNLSRIHALLTQTAVDIRRLLDDVSSFLESNSQGFIFPIFESTTEADIESFLQRLADRRNELCQAFQESRQILEYSFYLRREMDAANRSSGVADKLLEQNNLKKKLAHLYRLRQIIGASCSQGLEELKGAEYYKASFTENQKVYDLPVKMFSEKDHAAIKDEIARTEKAVFDYGNEIAHLNQTTLLAILSFEEFRNRLVSES